MGPTGDRSNRGGDLDAEDGMGQELLVGCPRVVGKGTNECVTGPQVVHG